MNGASAPLRPGSLPPVVALLAAVAVTLAASPTAAVAQDPLAAVAQDPLTAPAARQPSVPPDSSLEAPTPLWVRLAGGVTGLAALATFDPALRHDTGPAAGEPFGAKDGGFAAEVTEFGNSLGNWKRTLPLLAGVSMAVGGATEGLDGMGRAAAVLAGVTAGSFANETLNQAIGRARPSWEEGALDFDPFSGHASFPSGHTAFAFSIAGGIDAVTEGWLPAALAYGAATTSAFARVYADRHWFSDVVVGAAVGAFVSREATHRVLRLLDLERGAEAGRGPERPTAAASRATRGPTTELVATPDFLGVRVSF